MTDTTETDQALEVPAGNIDTVQQWVNADPAARAGTALAAENLRPKPRGSLVEWLEQLLVDELEFEIAEPGPAPAEDLVLARWVNVQEVFVGNGQGLRRYGDPIWVPAEQIDASPDLVEFVDDWTPDPVLAAASRKEG